MNAFELSIIKPPRLNKYGHSSMIVFIGGWTQYEVDV